MQRAGRIANGGVCRNGKRCSSRAEPEGRLWRKATQHAVQFATDLSAELVCDYGENGFRVLIALAVGFDATGSVLRHNGSGAPGITDNRLISRCSVLVL